MLKNYSSQKKQNTLPLSYTPKFKNRLEMIFSTYKVINYYLTK